LIAAEAVTAGKPAPDGYLLAAERLHRRPGECAVIEDSDAGCAAGRDAQMVVIELACGSFTANAHQETRRAHARIKHLGELRATIARLGYAEAVFKP
jgi:sugar-phosphatase